MPIAVVVKTSTGEGGRRGRCAGWGQAEQGLYSALHALHKSCVDVAILQEAKITKARVDPFASRGTPYEWPRRVSRIAAVVFSGSRDSKHFF